MARAITTSEGLIRPTALIDLNMTRIPVSELGPACYVPKLPFTVLLKGIYNSLL